MLEYRTERFLKTIEPHFTDLWEGRKKVEFRFDDRNFQVGDILHLLQYDELTNLLSGKKVVARVTHILKSEEYLQPNYCALSLGDIEIIDETKIIENTSPKTPLLIR